MLEAYQHIMGQFFILNIFCSLVIVFFQRRTPATVWAWLLLLNFVPGVGFLIYLVFGMNFYKKRMFRAKEIEGDMEYAARRQEESITRGKIKLADEKMKVFEPLVLYNLRSGKSVLTSNNDIQIYTEGKNKFEALLAEIWKAEKYIHMEYYIFRDDEVWRTIKEALIRKVYQGTEVRILFDSMGCREMKRTEWEELECHGIKVAEFFPAWFGRFQLRANYRNHRKIVVIDGRVGFVGGFNVGREYVGMSEKFGHWRDTHICVEGAAVISLAVRFILDWNHAAKENLFLRDELFEMPVFRKKGEECMQIISSGPDSEIPEIRNNYLQLIYMARKNIRIQTPYFVPDDNIKDALIIAARSGIEVELMIPCMPDHPFVYWASYSYMGEMIRAGVRCYLYEDGFLHAKCITVDGLVTCLGTANMDIRSFALNFEVNAMIYSEKKTRELDHIFDQDRKVSRLMTLEEYEERSMGIRLKEQFCRLLSPVL